MLNRAAIGKIIEIPGRLRLGRIEHGLPAWNCRPEPAGRAIISTKFSGYLETIAPPPVVTDR
jgi:hypothetical protein